ncbi:MAG: 5-formyltetrahydrofolate cyclo-ligase [Aeromicrobium sp.]
MDDQAVAGGDKDALRRSILTARRQLSDDARATAADAIAAHLLAAPFTRVERVAAYLSMGSEPGTGELIDGFVARGAEVILPVTGPDQSLDWVLHVPGAPVTMSAVGIPEPGGPRLGAGALSSAGLVIVPALAVDHGGWRLGRGAGYYDRALPSAGAPVCALVYASELLEVVPHEDHDVPVDLVVTEAGIFRVP